MRNVAPSSRGLAWGGPLSGLGGGGGVTPALKVGDAVDRLIVSGGYTGNSSIKMAYVGGGRQMVSPCYQWPSSDKRPGGAGGGTAPVVAANPVPRPGPTPAPAWRVARELRPLLPCRDSMPPDLSLGPPPAAALYPRRPSRRRRADLPAKPSGVVSVVAVAVAPPFIRLGGPLSRRNQRMRFQWNLTKGSPGV